MRMSRILLTISEELRAVLDVARRGKPLNPFIEKKLTEHPEVKKVAKRKKIKLPDRPDDGRGKGGTDE